MNLSADYTRENAIKILHRLAISSIHPVRLKILLELIKTPNISTTGLQKKLSIGWKNINTQLYTAKQLRLVNYTETEEMENEAQHWKKKELFVTEHEVIKYLQKIQKTAETNVKEAIYQKAEQKAPPI
jgi:hypothetical protein